MQNTGTTMEKKTKKTLALSAAIIGFTLLVIIIIHSTKGNARAVGGDGGGVQFIIGDGGGPAEVVSVKTYAAKIADLTDYVITNGEIKPQSSIEVFPSMNGKLSALNVLLGSPVKKGDVIAKIDPSEPGTNYELNPVIAPISGSIVSVPLRVGAKVSTGTAVATIGDIANLQISANIPERYVADLRTGLKAEVFLEAYPEAVFEAAVSRVSPVVDAATRTKQILLTFTKPDSRVNAGMFARIKLYTATYSGLVTVPASAVIANDGASHLFVMKEDGTVSRRDVKTAREVDGVIQIAENLAAGEKVVYEGMLTLFDGASVLDITDGNAVAVEASEDMVIMRDPEPEPKGLAKIWKAVTGIFKKKGGAADGGNMVVMPDNAGSMDGGAQAAPEIMHEAEQAEDAAASGAASIQMGGGA